MPEPTCLRAPAAAPVAGACQPRSGRSPGRAELLAAAACAALLVGGAALPGFAALGPNLLANANFDTDLAGWSEVSSSTWIPTDGAAEIGSGSARLYNPGSHVGTRPTQCVAVTAGLDYVASALFRLSESSFSGGLIEVTFHGDANCGVQELAVVETDYLFLTDRWARVGSVIRAPAGAKSATFQIATLSPDEAPHYVDAAYFGRGKCAASPGRLCLNDDRFAVSATWATAKASGEALAVPFGADSGSFLFFNLDNVELNVKVLDGCGVNQRYWLFAAGLTNAGVTITVTDTRTGQQKVYTNPLGKVFAPITDTGAFATCP